MKHVLATKGLADNFFEDSRLMGIMSPMRDYQFCRLLNNLLGMDFRLQNDLEIQLKRKDRLYYFAVYEYAERDTCLKHYLYNNECSGEYLLPEFKHLDFLWLLKEDVVTDEALNLLVTSIKTLETVQLVTELNYDKLKNKEHLIL